MDAETIVVYYEVSEKVLREEMIATGKRPPRRRVLTLSLADLTPDQRQPLVDHLLSHMDLDMSHPVIFDPQEHNGSGYVRLYWDHVPTLEEIIATASADMIAHKAIVEHCAIRDRKNRERLEAEARERAALQEIENQRAREREEQKAAAQAAWDAEMRRWAAEQGSDHLKLCLEGGYRCDRIYVLERAAVERPGWIVDFYDRAGWKERTNPSLEALIQARDETIDTTPVRVVWITAPPRADPGEEFGEELGEEFEPREGLVICGYLGKYDLVRWI